MFDINHQDFLDIFEMYGKTSGSMVQDHLRTVTLSGAKKEVLQGKIDQEWSRTRVLDDSF